MRRNSLVPIALCILIGTAIGLAIVQWWPRQQRAETQRAIARIQNGQPEEGKATFEAMLASGVPNAEANYWIGVAWHKLGDPQKAVDAFTEAIAVDEQLAQTGISGTETRLQRDASEVLVQRSISYLDLKQFDSAIADLSHALRSNRYDATAYCKRGIAFLGDGFPELAKADLQEAVLLDPQYVEALLNHAKVSLQLGDNRRALKDARSAIRAEPNCQEGYEIMARSYLADGQYLKAANCARKLAAGPAAGIQHLVEVAEQSAVTDEELDLPEGATRRVTMKIALPDPRPVEAQTHFQSGLTCIGDRQWDEAVDQFTAALNLYPNDPEAFYQRGMAFVKQGFPDTAIKDFNQVLLLEPAYAPALRERARAWLLLGDLLAAIDDGTRALSLNPDDAEAHLLRARAYLEARQYSRTLADLRQVEKLDPRRADEVKPVAAEALQGRGQQDLRAGRWDSAIADLEEAVGRHVVEDRGLTNLLVEAYQGRGRQRAEQGRVDDALADLGQAIRLQPQQADSYRLRGEIHAEAKDWEAAIADFDRAAEIAPERAFRVRPGLAKAHYRRGQANQQEGRTAQAQADFARATELGWQTL